MAITRSDLLIFNNVESTDVLQGIVEVPFLKPIPYVPNVTFSIEHEQATLGQGGRGSQVLIRTLGKPTVKTAKATDANGLRFTHAQTADDLEVVLIDDVASHSEEVFEAVEAARQSETGAAKAKVSLDTVLEQGQAYISNYLTNSAVESDNTDVLTADTIYEAILTEYVRLDYNADTLAVGKTEYGYLLRLVSTGQFNANSSEDAIRTGVLGTILGMNVIVDDNLDADFVIYNSTKFPVFTLFQVFDMIEAADFKGSYARSQILLGGGRKPLAIGDVGLGKGIWAIKYIGA